MHFAADVSIPAVRVRYIIMRFVMCLILDSFNSRSAGKIHFHCSHLALVSICFNSRSAGKIHWAAIDRHARRAGVSIPAVRVRYIYIGPEMEDANGVSIPAVRVRYIAPTLTATPTPSVSIPAVRVRYISKNNENAQKNLQYNLCNFLSLLFYYSESLKLCLPFAQKSKKIFPVFIFSPVRGPVL